MYLIDTEGHSRFGCNMWKCSVTIWFILSVLGPPFHTGSSHVRNLHYWVLRFAIPSFGLSQVVTSVLSPHLIWDKGWKIILHDHHFPDLHDTKKKKSISLKWKKIFQKEKHGSYFCKYAAIIFHVICHFICHFIITGSCHSKGNAIPLFLLPLKTIIIIIIIIIIKVQSSWFFSLSIQIIIIKIIIIIFFFKREL